MSKEMNDQDRLMKLEVEHAHLLTAVSELKVSLETAQREMHALNQNFTRYGSFTAGVIAAVSAIWGLVLAIWHWFPFKGSGS